SRTRQNQSGRAHFIVLFCLRPIFARVSFKLLFATEALSCSSEMYTQSQRLQPIAFCASFHVKTRSCITLTSKTYTVYESSVPSVRFLQLTARSKSDSCSSISDAAVTFRCGAGITDGIISFVRCRRGCADLRRGNLGPVLDRKRSMSACAASSAIPSTSFQASL